MSKKPATTPQLQIVSDVSSDLLTAEERRLQIRLLNELFGCNPEVMSREVAAQWLTEMGDAMATILDDAQAFVGQCLAKREAASKETAKERALKAKLAELQDARAPKRSKK